jgi:hypothetical protein
LVSRHLFELQRVVAQTVPVDGQSESFAQATHWPATQTGVDPEHAAHPVAAASPSPASMLSVNASCPPSSADLVLITPELEQPETGTSDTHTTAPTTLAHVAEDISLLASQDK